MAVLLGLVLITIADAWAADRVQLSPLLVAAPAITASFGGPRLTALMGMLAVGCQLIIGLVHGDFFSMNHPVQVAALALLSLLIVFYCRQRVRRSHQLQRVRSVSEATQQAVLRPLPHRMGPLRIASRYLAAEDEAHIGGDLYAVTRTENATRLIIGDVRGNGLPAISDASALMGAFREAAHQYATVTGLAEGLEGSICRHLGEYSLHSTHATMDDLEEHFVTVLMLHTPDDTPVAQMINCGHPPPLLLRKDGVTTLHARPPQPPLGLCTLPRTFSSPDVFTFEGDDTLLLYTDGVIEARAPDGSFYPLAERVAQWADLGPEALLNHIGEDVLAHVGGRLDDDAAMVVIQRLPTLRPVGYLKKVAHVDGIRHGAEDERDSPGATGTKPSA
ncbi:PP2C family protein-serine/threonine phosphatase [Streptomyces sp. TP-A0356]|uniref:PP2C family protein-serine/threonine phosphatase n=1 Tax=Streptomyces sp. TP-A0356 TaxID=1359208 RepID=UPI0007C84138|nr:PP2C family protein-serine/threonine phosphatase [Streptomyces sp. TP-A0356]